MQDLHDYRATARQGGKPTMTIRHIRALDPREAAAIAISHLRDADLCTPGTSLTISDFDSRAEKTLTVTDWTRRPVAKP